MFDLILLVVVALLATLVWIGFDSDDDGGGGGLMQPLLVPVRTGRSRP